MATGTGYVDYGTTESESTWAIAEGVVLIILGIIALFARYSIVTALTLAFPLYLVIKGILEIVAGVRAQGEGGAVWDVAFGIIAVLAGVLLFARPALSGLTIVAILAGYFFVVGISRIVVSFVVRSIGGSWGWTLAAGIVEVLLGIYMLTAPAATLAAVAVLIGIDILITGIAMTAIGFMERTHHAPSGVTPA
jgi:uncharacterized membrane protein HdeD (DUF308 family)